MKLRLLLLLFTALFYTQTNFAAFSIQRNIEHGDKDAAGVNIDARKHSDHPTIARRLLNAVNREATNLLYPRFMSGRHRGLAIGICLLGLMPFSFFLMGVDRMYYGYWLIGCIQFLGFFAILLGLSFITLESSVFLAAAVPLLVFGGLMYLWQLTDLIRLIQQDLVPKNERWSGLSRANRNRR